mgnify:CR=1 FL=1
MAVTIDAVARYLKLKARADHPATPPEERAIAEKLMASMEKDEPHVTAVADRVAAVLDGGREGPVPWQQFVQDVLVHGIERSADSFAGQVSGADRYADLGRGHCDFTEHACAEGQVCLEVRVRARDVVSKRYRDELFDRIEDELVMLAHEAGR